MENTNYGKIAAQWLEADGKVVDSAKDLERCKKAMDHAGGRLHSLTTQLRNSVSAEEPRRLIRVDDEIIEVVFGSPTTVIKLVTVDVYRTPKALGVIAPHERAE
jgi:hypothetical protein